ncbi:MAG: pyruvate, phosphate dikinase [Candidatus Omnitrophica bacterium]|nr:pyruvate, phosphate dikinase [Candidatus Omnitrophota bacterium]
MSKYVYFFGGGKAEGKADMKNLLGGKGANLAEMTNLGIPVPPGFTISTEACIHYYKDGGKYPDGLMEEIEENIKKLEALVNKKFGDEKNPLLVSVRSGAAVSMPGMMDTILNLGLNDKTAKGLIASTKNERFVYDAYRRFLQMFGDVVLGIEHSKFEKILQMSKDKLSIKDDTGLDAKTLKEIVSEYKELIKNELGKDFPDNPKEHLKMAYDAVFNSWNNKRAITYRNIHNIPHTLGTAVNIQAMVFGNMGSTSGTGVCFTRDPSTGEKRFYGEYLINAQGEDVVAGIRTPLPIEHLKKDNHKIYDELVEIYQKMEKHYRDMQDLEFTIENSKLYLLQTRSGKRTAQSAVKIAVDMVGEGLIDRNTALLRIEPESLEQLLHPTINPKAAVKVIAKGLPASPGAAVGKVIFSSHKAIELGEGGEKVILVRKETSPEDIGGMAEAQGILTSTGGMTSHAAVVGRGMGKCCVVGCTAITVREDEGYFEADTMRVKEGDIITLNGSTGEVILGETELIEPQFSDSFKTLMEWADNTRKLGVRANADTPYDAKVARDFGAEGIGLCRTEHMFFGKDRLPIVRQMILAKDKGERVAALQKLLPMQKGDFKGIFKVMEKLPVTIRLLDPPLHEFLPTREEEMESVASEMKISVKELKDKVASLHEFNPMLGHRGCRLGITYPEVYDMQVQAIFEAACELVREGQKIIPEVMIPLVGHINEFKITKAQAIKTAEEVMARFGVQLNYLIGTMIELPRAALTADEIAKEADFFSFGTNDLTQMTFGFSRDDAGKFLPSYKEKGILERDPFVTIDQAGVGQLIKIGVQKGRSANPKLKVGICGEHGGEPLSVEFCHRAGLNYVSCSPYRVPIARFSAAQAVLKEK